MNRVNGVIRKVAHFSLYLCVGLVTMSLMIVIMKGKMRFRWLISLAIGIIYAVSDEIHQMFVDGRSAMITDVMIDSCGVIVGILVSIGIYKLHNIDKRNVKNSLNQKEGYP